MFIFQQQFIQIFMLFFRTKLRCTVQISCTKVKQQFLLGVQHGTTTMLGL